MVVGVAVQNLDAVVAAFDDAHVAAAAVAVLVVLICEMLSVHYKWFAVYIAVVVVVVATDDDEDACNSVAVDAYSNYSCCNCSFVVARHLLGNACYSYSYLRHSIRYSFVWMMRRISMRVALQ